MPTRSFFSSVQDLHDEICEGAKISLPARLLAPLLGLERASLSMSDQKWRISLKLVTCGSKVYSTVIESKAWLWNQIRIADYLALMLLKAQSGKLEQDRGK